MKGRAPQEERAFFVINWLVKISLDDLIEGDFERNPLNHFDKLMWESGNKKQANDVFLLSF